MCIALKTPLKSSFYGAEVHGGPSYIQHTPEDHSSDKVFFVEFLFHKNILNKVYVIFFQGCISRCMTKVNVNCY